MPDTKLNYVRIGPDEGDVVVFLHGFAGNHTGWANLQVGLASLAQTIAFDLPGHGASLDYPKTCNAVVAAKAVLADLEALGVFKAHLVGHSMGGAVASLIALRQPELVQSMTLLAPGGFGPEINQSLLRNYARASTVDGIHMLLEQFFGLEFDLPKSIAEQVAEDRKKPGALSALQATAEAIIDGKVQKTLPLAEIGSLPIPIKVVWGEQDRVLPSHQCRHLPSMMAVHAFPKVGHMPHLEVGREVLSLIRQNIRAAGR